MNRLWDLFQRDHSDLPNAVNDTDANDTRRKLHQTIEKVHNDLDRFKFNTSIAALMEFTNHLSQAWNNNSVDADLWRECTEKFLLMLAPFAPHIAEELWERNGHPYSVHNHAFPKWDPALTAEETITLVVQVNGRLRDRLQTPASITEEEVREMALASPRVQAHTQGKKIQKLIYVPNRLINIVAP